MTLLYDPPSGWKYGFPKPYKPRPGEDLKDTLLRDGYPQKEIDNGGAKWCRFLGSDRELDNLKEDESLSNDIGWAVTQLRANMALRRKGWNGKGMFIVLMPALYLTGGAVNARTSKWIGAGNDLDSQPYIAMYTAQGQWQPGWLASQADLLATDWETVAHDELPRGADRPVSA